MKYALKLYVTDEVGKSVRALLTLRDLRQSLSLTAMSSRSWIILKKPERAAEDHIIAVPALIRKLPLPVRKVIGDLSDRESVINAMGMAEIVK